MTGSKMPGLASAPGRPAIPGDLFIRSPLKNGVMNSEEIQSFLSKQTPSTESYVRIDFKKRDPIYGLFIQDKDFNELKSKNFWRIVTRSHFDSFRKSKDTNLARIFNGAEFSKLTSYQASFE
jgi:hypothetical protein